MRAITKWFTTLHIISVMKYGKPSITEFSLWWYSPLKNTTAQLWLNVCVVLNKWKSYQSVPNHSRYDFEMSTVELLWRHQYMSCWLLWHHADRLFSQIARFMGPTWDPPGSCRPQMGPMLAPWTLLSGLILFLWMLWSSQWHCQPGTFQHGNSLSLFRWIYHCAVYCFIFIVE